MKISIASDHAGFELKKCVINYIKEQNHSIFDFGCESESSCDYPDYIHPLAKNIQKKKYDLGIIICGSGNGVNMTANKYNNVRSALCWTKEISIMAKQHNNANVLAIPARYVSKEVALEIIESFINTKFEGGRHKRRVEKINAK